MLANLSLNLGVLFPTDPVADAPRVAVVQVPGGLARLVRVPGSESPTFVWLEELVRLDLDRLFPGQEIRDAACFRVTRDSELDLDDEGGRDYVERSRKS